eukprot:jgi/Mesvir1/15114/Mv14754-RA.1
MTADNLMFEGLHGDQPPPRVPPNPGQDAGQNPGQDAGGLPGRPIRVVEVDEEGHEIGEPSHPGGFVWQGNELVPTNVYGLAQVWLRTAGLPDRQQANLAHRIGRISRMTVPVVKTIRVMKTEIPKSDVFRVIRIRIFFPVASVDHYSNHPRIHHKPSRHAHTVAHRGVAHHKASNPRHLLYHRLAQVWSRTAGRPDRQQANLAQTEILKSDVF